jgi:hypothetical protein
VSLARYLYLWPFNKGHESIAQTLDQPMPHLEDMNLAYNVLPMRGTFLGGVSHTLRNLELNETSIESFPDLPSLRQLNLERVYVDMNCRTLYRLLQRCPQIEQITIEDLLLDEMVQEAFDNSGSRPVLDTQDLAPELTSLTLEDHTAELNWTLLSALRMPKKMLRVSGRIYDSGAAHVMTTPLAGYHAKIVHNFQSWWKKVSGEGILGVGPMESCVHDGERRDILTLSNINAANNGHAYTFRSRISSGSQSPLPVSCNKSIS